MASKEYVVKKSEINNLQITLKMNGSYTIKIVDNTVCFFEIGDTLLRFNSAVLLPTETEPSADNGTRPGLAVIAACIDYASKKEGKKMLIPGHTDTVGSDEANINLSRIRAETVHGMITGNRDQFANACFGPHLSNDQRYPDGGSGKKKGVLWDDYIDVLNWVAKEFAWSCGYPTGNSTLWGATVAFQKNFNKSTVGDVTNKPIPEHGSFDKKTWGAVYDCYEVKLAELLKTDVNGLSDLRKKIVFLYDDSPEKHYVACGEFKPIEEKTRDNYRSQTNRRVEVMFFDEGEDPKTPCSEGICDAALCQLFNADKFKRRNLPIELGIPIPEDDSTIHVRLHDDKAEIMPETFYRYRYSYDREWSGSLQADVDGWASIPESLMCPESLEVEWEISNQSGSEDTYVYSRKFYVECCSTDADEPESTSTDATVIAQRLHNLGYDTDILTVEEAEMAFRSDYSLVDTQKTSEALRAIYKDKECDACYTFAPTS